MRIDISDRTFARLQARAAPLVDSVDDVIVKLLDATEGSKAASRVTQTSPSGSVKPAANRADPTSLRGFQKELWDLVISKMPFETFTLRDVYDRKAPLVTLRPNVQEIEASIRGTLERLRDRNFIEFVDNRGNYRKLA
jgi:hypothetical protein